MPNEVGGPSKYGDLVNNGFWYSSNGDSDSTSSSDESSGLWRGYIIYTQIRFLDTDNENSHITFDIIN